MCAAPQAIAITCPAFFDAGDDDDEDDHDDDHDDDDDDDDDDDEEERAAASATGAGVATHSSDMKPTPSSPRALLPKPKASPPLQMTSARAGPHET